jgi:hypothetical protein
VNSATGNRRNFQEETDYSQGKSHEEIDEYSTGCLLKLMKQVERSYCDTNKRKEAAKRRD